MKNKRTFLLHLLFVFYLAALTWIILFKMAVSFDTIDHGIRSLNLIPFKGAMITNGRINFSEMIDNILVFCPFGIYIGVLYRRWNLSEKVLYSSALLLEVRLYLDFYWQFFTLIKFEFSL